VIFLIDGPEKAGKTTLISELASSNSSIKVRHWGPVDPDDRVYLELLKHDALSPNIFVWDRAWPSEHVYAKLLNRNRRLKNDPWLGEWLYGRAVMASGGVRIMVLRSPELLRKYRTPDDLDVDVAEEHRSYWEYATKFRYLIFNNDDNPSTIREFGATLSAWMREWQAKFVESPLKLPSYAGTLTPSIIVVGESLSSGRGIPGSWLPFTSPATIKFARMFGDRAITNMGWTNINGIPKSMLGTKALIACGQKAGQWISNNGANVALHLPHPAHWFRYNNEATKRLFKEW